MLAVTLALAVLIGVALGLLGGGGSILTVPVLVYAAGMGAKEAIAASLLVVGVTSAVAAVSHARAGRVRWRTGLIFGVAGMTGAYGGGRLAEFVPGTVLLVGFGLMMLATAAAMIRGRRGTEPAERQFPVLKVMLEGVVVGLVTGLVGAGGGFLIVPALVLLGGLPMSVAVGTSLIVISMKSFAGLAGYLASVQIDWGLAGAVTAAAVVGSLLGGSLVGRIPPQTLRKSFGWFVLVMAIFVLGQQVPWQHWASTALLLPATPLVALATTALSWYWWTQHRNRSTDRATGAGPGTPEPEPGPASRLLHQHRQPRR